MPNAGATEHPLKVAGEALDALLMGADPAPIFVRAGYLAGLSEALFKNMAEPVTFYAKRLAAKTTKAERAAYVDALPKIMQDSVRRLAQIYFYAQLLSSVEPAQRARHVGQYKLPHSLEQAVLEYTRRTNVGV